jgi:hypothetical protein
MDEPTKKAMAGKLDDAIQEHMAIICKELGMVVPKFFMSLWDEIDHQHVANCEPKEAIEAMERAIFVLSVFEGSLEDEG